MHQREQEKCAQRRRNTLSTPVVPRRSLLAGLSAASVAMAATGLPSAVLAHPAASMADTDADLITLAAQVERLARLLDRANERDERKSDAVMLACGPRPTEPRKQGGSVEFEDLPTNPTSDIERVFITRFRKPSVEDQEAMRRYAEALAAWQTKAERLKREAGAAEARTLCFALSDRLKDAAALLAGTPATSPAGMAAKARAFLALMWTRDGAEEWEADLGRSLARDAMLIGTSAA